MFTDRRLLLIAEDEEPVATPLIPLMEECETALEDKIFQKFLYTIGINPPVDEQVRYLLLFQQPCLQLVVSVHVLLQLDYHHVPAEYAV